MFDFDVLFIGVVIQSKQGGDGWYSGITRFNIIFVRVLLCKDLYRIVLVFKGIGRRQNSFHREGIMFVFEGGL